MKVDVLIDLDRHNAVGGHVNSWLQFARVAMGLPSGQLSLTLHFLGEGVREEHPGPNVRYVYHPPRFSTRRLPFLRDVPSDTDLAPHNPRLLPYFEATDILHVTHPLFTFGATAQRYCRRSRKPLVCSLHTDAPLYAQLYLEEKIQRSLGGGWLSSLCLHTLKLPDRYRSRLDHQQQRYWQGCQHVWVGQPAEMDLLGQLLPPQQVSYLRRGLDAEIFHPHWADRSFLAHHYQLPQDCFWVLFVGRLDACKQVMTFAQAVKILQDQGVPIHGIAVGKGSAQAEIEALLGPGISCLGTLPQEKLNTIYASCDLFVFPSETEIMGNVVIEARASGLPVLISDQGGSQQHLQASEKLDQVIAGQDPRDWASRIQHLYENPLKRQQMGQLALEYIQRTWPTWETVFREDLLPVWQAIALPPSSPL